MKDFRRDGPLVSICIPNYNKAKFIEETVKSVFSQVYRNIEVIVIDDCSNDKSLKIIDQLKAVSPFPFYVYSNDVNKGVSFSSNKGAGLAKGKYFQILSSDDVILPSKIVTQVAIMETDENIGAVYGGVHLIDEDSKPLIKDYFQDIGWTRKLPSGNIFSALLQMNFIPAPTTLLRLKCVIAAGNYDTELRLEDWDMLLTLAESQSIQYCNEIFALYRIEKNSLMRGTKNRPIMFNAMCQTLFKRLGSSRENDSIIWLNIKNYAGQIYTSGGDTAKFWLKKSLKRQWNFKNFMYLVAAQLGVPYSLYNKIRKNG